MIALAEDELTAPREPASDAGSSIDRSAQALWASIEIKARLGILRAARHRMAGMSKVFTQAISPELSRNPADTLVAELLPLLAAGRFLEHRAESLLAARKLGRRGLPFWLAGVRSEVHRVPFGHVLVIGPSNYPLFLPGVQVLQALVAGNAVTWKPGYGGRPVADLFAAAMRLAGLPEGLLHITGESIAAGEQALREPPDKVFFTGAATTGRLLMRRLAETLTPSVMELSGCDAVIVLPSAPIDRVTAALAFGMRLNGSATCMAPRRVLLVDATPARRAVFLQALRSTLREVPAVSVSAASRAQLCSLLREAEEEGATIEGDRRPSTIQPILALDVQPTMRLAQADLFAPVLSLIEVRGREGILAAQEACPYALTAAIFGDEREARGLSAKLTAGTIIINDLIVPTADPRLPFGGRRGSGFGTTRGAEGLLEMTAIKTIAVRRDKTTRHYEATTAVHADLFHGILAASHARTWAERWHGLKQMATSGKQLASRTTK